ncbi:MAG TPA: hypothetical protein PLY93_01060 [Turneriella sp.]|nr:hypothetical protein [Turneriella sp.]
MKDYHVNIFYSDEDEGYIADIRDLNHSSTFGNTPEEELCRVGTAKTLWFETAKKIRKRYRLRYTNPRFI